MKTLIQCDFDGTITEEDMSYLLLDGFADGNWRQLLEEYREGKISVGYFNTKAFAMIKADRQTLVDYVRPKVKIRPGFHELLAYCRRKDFEFVIISNGLDFYIDTILKDIEVDNIKVFAAQTQFSPEGVKVKYIGPEGNQLQDDFKETHTKLFLSKGYRVIYLGNGLSDVPPAKLSHLVFATGDLLTCCKEINLKCTPFTDLNYVVRILEQYLE